MKAASVRFLTLTATLAALVATATAETTKFESQPGSKVKIDGTSTIHDWTVEGGIIAGSLELDSKFVTEPAKAQPGKVDAKVEVSIPVRTLKSGKTSMDNIMYQAMKQQQFPKIEYRLTELKLKETPKSDQGPYTFDSTGELVVSGKTNKLSFPVTMTRTGKTLKTTGTTSVKMTQFGIAPPAPKIALGMISTGDDVKLTFDWVTSQK